MTGLLSSRFPPSEFQLERWHPFRGEPTTILEGGEKIDLGGRTIEVLHTPGHSPGHICLYDEERGFLATGDVAYEGTIDLW